MKIVSRVCQIEYKEVNGKTYRILFQPHKLADMDGYLIYRTMLGDYHNQDEELCWMSKTDLEAMCTLWNHLKGEDK